jgi:uncharacterized protein DUF6893
MKKILGGVVLAIAGVLAFAMPSLRRYLKMEKM